MANSLATTVATPAKWVGRAAPSSGADTSATDTVVSTGRRVHLVDRRHEQQVDPRLGGQGRVPVEVARVGVEVLARAELQRVHEHRGHRRRRSRPGPPASARRGRRAGSPSSARTRRCGRRPARVERARSSAIVATVFTAERWSVGGRSSSVPASADAAARRGAASDAARPRPAAGPRRHARSPGARRGQAPRCRRSVASSPRAAGPVIDAAGPELGDVGQGVGGEVEVGGERHADRLGQPLGLAEQGHQVVRGDDRGRVVGGPVGVGDGERAAAAAPARPRRPAGRRPRRTSRPTRRRAPSSGVGSDTSGCTAARRGCGASTSRPRAPARWATTVPSAGADGPGDVPDLVVGRGDHQQVDALGGRGPRRRPGRASGPRPSPRS